MKIKIVSLILKQEAEYREAEAKYIRRIARFLPCELIEVKRRKIMKEGADSERLLREEAKAVRGLLKESSALAVLHREGKGYDSEEFARWLGQRAQEGSKEIIFLLGGPLGLSAELMAQARWKLSLSRLTFSHKMARLILLEALYRSCEILKGSAYHK